MKSYTSKISFVASLLITIALPAFVFALPEGESVVAGSATFDRSQLNTLNVNTPSDKLIVNYNGFSIAQPETVNFQQPSASSIVLNRVVGIDPSSIMGTLNANGRVFIVNPNGVVFGPNSHVDVAGLVASSLNISNDDFLNGNYVFSKSGKNGYVINQGTINAKSGGYVCLLGGAVDNRLAIQADLGTVVMASGEKITVALEDQNAISVVVDEAVQSEVFGPDGNKMTSAVKNSGTILAEGGKVMLTAKVLNRVFDYAINNSGLVKVTSLVKHDGVIELMAEGAPVINSGTLEADKVVIKASNADLINTKEGKIIANAVAAASPDGGKVFIQATSVLQQGLVSANAIELGTAGEVTITSEGTTTFDESSCTEARAMGIVGNGGRITLTSKTGSVFVNKNAKIDFSAGSIAGNGGLVKVDAFQQLGFYGILNGRAPPGFKPGIAILDPEYATINFDVSAYTIVTVDAYRDITITGNLSIGFNGILNLYADHLKIEDQQESYYIWDNTYNPGIGAIINSGDFTISGDGTLNLKAGSGIGTLENPIQTNVSYLSAEIRNYAEGGKGDIFIDQGTTTLNINNISGPGMVVLYALGSIQESYNSTGITADELYLETEGGIYGYEGPFSISVNNLVVLNEGSGSIELYNDKDLVVLSAINTAGEAVIDIAAAGDLRVRYGIEGNGDIYLTSAEGDIILSTMADIRAPDWATVMLTAHNGAISRRDMERLDYGLLNFWDLGGQYFDGNYYINTGSYFGFGAGSFTIIAWYQGTQNAPYRGLFGAIPAPGTNSVPGYALQNHNGYLRYWLNGKEFISTIPINTGSWLQLSMVRDGTTGSMYIFDTEDTKYYAEFNVGSGSVDSSSSFWIGGWGIAKSKSGDSRLIQGNLDDVRVYNQALSGLEIFAQTQVAPGAGEILGGTVVLSAANGIDVSMNGVGRVSATNSVSGDINITNIGNLQVVSPGIYNHGGNIDLRVMSDLTILSTISTDAPGGSIYLSANEDILVDNQVSIYAAVGGSHSDPVQDPVSGDVTLSAGGNITFNYGAGVHSSADSSGVFDTGIANSGDVRLTAGGNISLDWANIWSYARIYSLQSAEAYSGSVIIDAGGLLTITEGSQIYSSAGDGTNPVTGGQSAYADSGIVSLSAGTGLSSNGTGAGYGADIYSKAFASAGYAAQAYSASVILSTDSGDITLSLTEFGSYAQAAYTGLANQPGSSLRVISGDSYYDYNNYENSYLAVLIDSGGSIVINDSAHDYANGYAVAQSTNVEEAYARSGDVTFDAEQNITLAEYLNTRASTNAGNRAESYSGKLTLVANDGQIVVPVSVESTADALVNLNSGSAYATSDDIDVHSWNGNVNVSSSIFSIAEAYGGGYGATTPALAQATSGDVLVYAGSSEDVYEGANLYLSNASIYSNAYTSGGDAQNLLLTSGNVSVYSAGSLSAEYSDIYTMAGDQGEGETSAVNATFRVGNVEVETGSYMDLFNSAIYSRAGVSCTGDATAYSGAVDILVGGPLYLTNSDIYTEAVVYGRIVEARAYGELVDEYFDYDTYQWVYVTFNQGVRVRADSDIDVSESFIFSRAFADSAGNYSTAISGDVDVDSYGTISVGTDTGGPVIYSQALAQGGDVNTENWGNLSVRAYGDIELNNSIMGGEIALIADWDNNGTGSFILPAGANLTLTGNRDYLQSADSFRLAESFGDGIDRLTLWGGDLSASVILVRATGEGYPEALSVISTAGSIDVNSNMYRDDYIVLRGATGLNINDDLESGYLDLYSGSGFYSGTGLYAYTYIKVEAVGNVVLVGNDTPAMSAGTYIDVTSTGGTVTVNNALLAEEGYIVINSYGSILVNDDLDAADYIRILAGVDFNEEEGYFVTNYEANLIIDATCTAGTFLQLAAGGITEMNAATAGTYIDLYSNGDVQINGGLIAGTDLNIETGGSFISGSLTASTGDVDVNAGGSVTVNGAVSANNYVHLISGGAMTLQDVSAGFGLDITADGNFTANNLTVEEGMVDGDIGGSVTMYGDISASDYVWLVSGSDMDLGSVTADSFIRLYSGGALTVGGEEVLSAGDFLEISTTGDIDLGALTSAGSYIDIFSEGGVTIRDDVTAGTSYLAIYAYGDIQIQTYADLSASTQADVYSAYENITLGGNVSANEVYVTAANDVTVNAVLSGGEYYEFYAGGNIQVNQNISGYWIDMKAEGNLILGGNVSAVYNYIGADGNLTINSSLSGSDGLWLYAGLDMYVNGDISALSIDMEAGNNFESEGPVTLTAMNHTLRAYRDFTVAGNTISYNEDMFSAVLDRGDYEYLQDLSVTSTGSTITISEAFQRDFGIVQFIGERGININAPITMGSASLYLTCDDGLINAASEVAGPHITSSGYVYIHSGYLTYTGEYPNYQVGYSETRIASRENPLDVLITGEGSLNVAAYGYIDGDSGVFTGTIRESTDPSALNVLNTPPGLILFNDNPANPPAPEPEPEPQPEPTPPEGPIAPTGDILANQPNPVNPGALNSYQFSSPIGTVFLYHPIVPTDMGALDQLAVGADAYSLRDGQLQLVGHEGLLQFFQEFDQSRKKGSL